MNCSQASYREEDGPSNMGLSHHACSVMSGCHMLPQSSLGALMCTVRSLDDATLRGCEISGTTCKGEPRTVRRPEEGTTLHACTVAAAVSASNAARLGQVDSAEKIQQAGRSFSNRLCLCLHLDRRSKASCQSKMRKTPSVPRTAQLSTRTPPMLHWPHTYYIPPMLRGLSQFHVSAMRAGFDMF